MKYTLRSLPALAMVALAFIFFVDRAEAAPAGRATGAEVEPADCMFDLPAGVVEGEDVVCGYLVVPEQHANPDGPTIRLAFAILKAQPAEGETAKPDPVFMLQGGPGGSTIDTYAKWLLREEPFPDRDVVLFDQRGTYYSEPSLVCGESLSMTLQTLEQRLTPEESSRLGEQSSLQCRARLLDEGVNLAAYNSLENAADIEALRDALDYGPINLYGVSYGTLLALHTMRNHPEHLRSVILDAVVPPDVNFRAEGPRSHDRAFSELFKACAADPACNTAYPGLEQVFLDTVKALDANPARMPLTDRETGRTYNAVFDGETLIGSMVQLLYSSELLPALPKIIYDARDGRFDFLSRILPQMVFDRTLAEGMYFSTLCAEDADYTIQDVQLDVRPRFVDDERRDEVDFLKLCAKWDVPALGPQVDEPVVSDIPTLVYSGQFDPVTPPWFGERVAKMLKNRYFFTWPAGSHGELLTNECTLGMAREFIDDPSTAPDSSCMADYPKPTFVTPATVMMTPATTYVLGMLEGQASRAPFFVYFLAMMAMLTLFVVWPAAWFVRAMSRKHGDPRPIARVPRWIAVVNAVLLVMFAAGFVVAFAGAILTGAELELLFGLPGESWWLFAISLLIIILTAAMAVFAVVAWIKRFWSGWGRVYYTALVLAAAVCVAVLLQLSLAFPLIGRILGRA